MMDANLVEETFKARDIRLKVGKEQLEHSVVLTFQISTDEECYLHWGLLHRPGDRAWAAPPETSWPPGSARFNDHAVQSPFASKAREKGALQIRLEAPLQWSSLPFVLYFPRTQRWLKNGKRDFQISLPRHRAGPNPEQVLRAQTAAEDWRLQHFQLGEDLSLAVAVCDAENFIRVLWACSADAPLLLHWGLSGRSQDEWILPPVQVRPEGSTEFDSNALQTPFAERDGLRWLELKLEPALEGLELTGINFVLYQPAHDRWLKPAGGDMHLGLRTIGAPEQVPSSRGRQSLQSLVDDIVDAEMGKRSWTLMHRFNLCHDLLAGCAADPEALALLYVWLRFSAIRQLDWQRRYNTKPRELARAQERLTLRLADVYRNHVPSRLWVRLMLTTMGPGGEGQRVRDEILNIMHRHHIKEAHGTFLEEWHQKLHNNTTPDDIVICEAYLGFLEAEGDLDTFYDVLERNGVSRERLHSFERPIRTDPEFYAGKKAGLSQDFENFLRILRSVHSGTDLVSALAAVGSVLDDQLKQQLDALVSGPRPFGSLQAYVAAITAARTALARSIEEMPDTCAGRDMLYLDLALEQTLRITIERQALRHTNLRTLTTLVLLTLRNLVLSIGEKELQLTGQQLELLLKEPRTSLDWALQVKSVTDRVARVVSQWSDHLFNQLQPSAESLGGALQVEQWTIPLFSEEVIRGSLPFVLSLLLRRLDPMLRTHAGIGGWQVISAAQVTGRVRLAESLLSVQGEAYPEPTILVTDRVAGDEEIPQGVTCVITSDTPDLVSHVAVRARNAHVLFASCFDDQVYEQVKGLREQQMSLQVSPAGDVHFALAEQAGDAGALSRVARTVTLRPQGFTDWAVTFRDFREDNVGAKSRNLNTLRGRLSPWIHFPVSIALPFGVFEAVLQHPENQMLRVRYEELLQQVQDDPKHVLPELRALLLGLKSPLELKQALAATWNEAGLAQTDPAQSWSAIRRVWASKWNERAYYSRVAHGIAHDALMIAVLIQQVVEADYAFVIHTVNPLTQRPDEVFAEVVLGMGETLVGNHPGRALAFLCRKDTLELTLLSYPSKSIGLYGRGVIFRSDSNGEDLVDFAGAGLYDSFLAEPPRERLLDYSQEPMLQDRAFCHQLLRRIARIAIEIEEACNSPQDIEGAVQGGEFVVVQTRPQVGLIQ